MECSTDLIIILFLIVNVQTGIIMSLLDSRNYWRKKWNEKERRKLWENEQKR